MYSKLKEEKDKEEISYKKELEEAQENFRIAQAENEKLRETNDIQNNLWKIWLKEKGNYNKNEDVSDNTVEEQDDFEEVAEIVKNKTRGFRRVTPAATSENQKVRKNNISNTNKTSAPVTSVSFSAAKTNNLSTPNQIKRFCHFWNNVGKCTYQNCKFLHEKAPLCKYDGKCNRTKCMFSHVNQNSSFLFNRQQVSPPTQSWHPWGPWRPSPWATPAQASAPWGTPTSMQWGTGFNMDMNMRTNLGQIRANK